MSNSSKTVDRGLPGALALLVLLMDCYAPTLLAGVNHVRLIHGGGSTDYPDVQDALNDAMALGGTLEIRIEEMTFTPVALSLTVGAGDNFNISGGWDSTFSNQNGNPNQFLTNLNAGSLGRTWDVTATGGELTIRRLKLSSGRSNNGGNLRVESSGDAQVFLHNLRIEGADTLESGTQGALGGGLLVTALEESYVEMETLTVIQNRAQINSSSTSDQAIGGGIAIQAFNDAVVWLGESNITGNDCQEKTGGELIPRGCNLYAVTRDNSDLTLSNNRMTNPRAIGDVALFPQFHGLNGHFLCSEFAQIREDNSYWRGGETTENLSAVYMDLDDDCSATLRSSLVADAPHYGLTIEKEGQGVVLRMSNHTITRNGRQGLSLGGDTVSWPTNASVYNLLAYDNDQLDIGHPDAPLDPLVDAGNNLVGVNPMFVNVVAGDYDLQPGSPARETGNPSPPGGLPSFDIIGRDRVSGQVDIGAWEPEFVFSELIFADDYEGSP